ncbi:hypothetical protein FJ365_01640 [Candidatus Dependentiae bacterium]|nr:hypothetical protein [Candidatus Dependentiae bacterium]
MVMSITIPPLGETMLKNISIKITLSLTIWLFMLIASYYLPLTSLSGSFRSVLSGINIVLPLAGGLFGMSMVCWLISSLWLVKTFFLTKALTFGIPSACAMLSWASNSKKSATKNINFLINAFLPALCMVVFMMHPASCGAWPYALYWLIPIAIWAINHSQNSLLCALQSTFVAHAVGSVMWVFLVPMTTSQWLALIPMVMLERISIAVLAASLYKITSVTTTLIVVKRIKKHLA